MNNNKNPPKIGYKKPPKASQFQKGKSGNPKGRPKKVFSLPSMILEELGQLITVTEGKKTMRVPKSRAYIKSYLARCMAKGDPKLLEFVIKHGAMFGIHPLEAQIPPVVINVSFAEPPKNSERENDLGTIVDGTNEINREES